MDDSELAHPLSLSCNSIATMDNLPLHDSLLELASDAGPQAWIGRRAPFAFTALDLLQASNFRASPGHHGRYRRVWIVEEDLGQLAPGQFELLLDEAVRMLPEYGQLVLRFTQSANCSIIALKHCLGRRKGARVSVVDERVDRKRYTLVLDVHRVDSQRYHRDDWCFAVLTQGERLDNLRAFFQSIYDQQPQSPFEILVCGPQLPKEFDAFQLRYAPGDHYRDHLAEISSKKNDLAQLTDRANLCIVHDRYRLQPGFFRGFALYGYDFDYVTIPQWYECGEPFPAYCALTQTNLSWSTPLDCRNYQALLPTQYVNGGLIIAKTATLREIPFNHLLFWNQAEDVELARAFRDAGLPPRINLHCSAVTLGIGPDYTKAIIPFYGQSLEELQGSLLGRMQLRLNKSRRRWKHRLHRWASHHQRAA